MKRALFFIVTLCICIQPTLAVDNFWNEGADINNDGTVDCKDFAIMAKYWLVSAPDIIWVDINDPGIGSGHEGFWGQISKYETTNAQYCQFLNTAKASGDIAVIGNYIVGVNGSNPGVDFVGQNYYRLDGPGYTYDGATNGGAARINYTGSSFTVVSRFKNHPVTYVSWYGATAFCKYYGWHLPTEWEWQAVADYDGSFTYGCGITINNNMANYQGSTHPLGTTTVGEFGTYGYGMADMAGNVLEWTSSLCDPQDSYRIICSGHWYFPDSRCTVSYRSSYEPDSLTYNGGFRVCRYATIVPNVVGRTQENAEAAIIGEGLMVGTVFEAYSDTVANGRVISQSPAGGENVPSGAMVDLVISIGPVPVPVITWLSMNDSGAGMKDGYGNPVYEGGFTGEMSKYETTNAQFAYYLNAAKATGDIYIDGNDVKGANGSNPGADFIAENYYRLDGPGNLATNGGASRINWTGSSFTVDSGFENHPVTYVNWYGATAFASYYAWRLPTEWEWQAVADFDGSYTYGCGTTINNSMANYYGSTHPDGTTEVGTFGIYGYGMADMAGNVCEWTSSLWYSSRIVRGGSWYDVSDHCTVWVPAYSYGGGAIDPDYMGYFYGFRVCH